MIRLTKSQVIGLHHALIERYGGIHGVRDEGLLDSALQAPYQTFDDIELYRQEISIFRLVSRQRICRLFMMP